ncbi:MAG TPA: NAD(P)H-binding protein [Marinilabiliaceae bacterium]|nr:NAD(P)H-binding protein [Marinilabiliaceae bacterium]
MTNNTKKIAVIAGSTGLIGGHLLQQLLNNPLYDKIYVPGRKAPKLTDSKIVFELCNFSEFKNLPKNGSIDLFCSLGTTIKKAGSQDQFREVDFDAVVNFARWGASISCNHFVVVSSIGANPKSRNFYLRTKGQMEQVLKAIGLNNLTIVRPSLLMGRREDFRFGEKVGEWLMKPLSFLLIGKAKKYRPIEGAQVAKGMIKLAQNKIGDTFVVEGEILKQL